MLKEKLCRFNQWNNNDIANIISCLDIENLAHLDVYNSITNVFNFNIDFITEEIQSNWLDFSIGFIDIHNFSLNDFLILFNKSSILLSTSKTLSITVNNFVSSLIPLKSDEGFDVSFSDPNLPFTVFVSIPNNKEKNSSERFIEGLIHEALHLQLTAIENIFPIVNEHRLINNICSPWKGEGRNARGLLHAIYVFSHLYHFWLNIHSLNLDDHNFAQNRCSEIKNQILEAQHLIESQVIKSRVLTSFGENLTKSLLDSGLYL